MKKVNVNRAGILIKGISWLVLVCSVGLASAQGKDPVVVKLDQQEVTLSEFNEHFEVAIRMLAAKQGIPYGSQSKEQIEQLRRQYLGQLARDVVLLNEAAKRGITVPQDELDAQVAAFRKSMQGEQDFQATLEKSGFKSESQLREMVKERQLISMTTAQITSEIIIPPGDVLVMHHDSEEELEVPEQICMRHIMVADEDTAQEIMSELNGGADFAAIAKEKSTDASSAAKGGDLGCFEKETTIPKSDFEKAAFNAKVNVLTGPVSSEFGQHVLIVYARKAAHVPNIDELYPELEQELKEERLGDVLADMYDESGVETFPDRLSGTQTD